MNRKLIISLILELFLSTLLHSQGTFSIFGDIGLGLTRHQFNGYSGGISGSYGIAARYAGYTLRYRLIDNADLSIFSPAHELISREILFGYAFHLTEKPKLFNLYLSIYTGVGSAEEIVPQYVSSSGPFNDLYRNVSRFSTCVPIELCFESRLRHYIGVSITLYATYSQFYPAHGLFLSFIIGYW